MLKGAIIGFGKIAQMSHMMAYSNHMISTKAKIVAAVETVQHNRERSQLEHPDIKFYPSLEELFNNEELDFVDITCPPKYHFEILLECIKQNVNIICEKPFTLSFHEAEIIKDKINASKLILIPCHQYKFSPIWSEFKKLAEQNHTSKKILQFNVFRMHADPGMGTANYWRTSSAQDGGGIITDTGIHYLYLAHWLLGEPIKTMATLTTLKHRNYNCEDTAFINLGCLHGNAQITVTWAADKRYNDARFVCDEWSLLYQGETELIINSNDVSTKITVTDASDKAQYAEQYVALFNTFFDAIIKKEHHPEWVEEAYQSIKTLNNCMLSSELDMVII